MPSTMYDCLMLNTFLKKCSIQNTNTGNFICPKCTGYSTNSGNEFNNHLRLKHSVVKSVQCIYCEICLPSNQIVSHVNHHIYSKRQSQIVCKLCCEMVSLVNLDTIIQHMKTHHPNCYTCVNCGKNMKNFGLLEAHLTRMHIKLYHCTTKGCRIKSNTHDEFYDHQKLEQHNDYDLEYILVCNLSLDMNNKPRKTLTVEDQQVQNNVTVIKERMKQIDESPENLSQNTSYSRTKSKSDSSNSSRASFCENFILRFKKEEWERDCHINSKIIDLELLHKLKSVEKFKIGRSKDDKVKYYCLACEYFSNHSFNDVKKHILSTHCCIHHSDMVSNSSYVMHISESNNFKSDIARAIQSRVRMTSSDTNSSNEIFNMVIPYSEKAFDLVFIGLNKETQNELKEKLKYLKDYMMTVDLSSKPKSYKCKVCSFYSNHSHVDVKRHIFRVHCSIKELYLADISKLSKLDNKLNLLPDEAIIQMFNNDSNNVRKRTIQTTNLDNSATNIKVIKREHEVQNTDSDDEMLALQNIKNRRRNRSDQVLAVNEIDTPVSEPVHFIPSVVNKEISLVLSLDKLMYNCKHRGIQQELVDDVVENLKNLPKYKVLTGIKDKLCAFFCSAGDKISHISVSEISRHIIAYHLNIPKSLQDPVIMSMSAIKD